jgi:hypothetical protein
MIMFITAICSQQARDVDRDGGKAGVRAHVDSHLHGVDVLQLDINRRAAQLPEE